jgi:hypothetical protein
LDIGRWFAFNVNRNAEEVLAQRFVVHNIDFTSVQQLGWWRYEACAFVVFHTPFFNLVQYVWFASSI